ncbi:MAG TPA: hypothetical protein VHO48_13945 [Anaerolineaceae bacterium]|nr:hypothetical protein [Anaerolineaceae bacterium]
MKSSLRWVFVLSLIALISFGCSAVTGSGSTSGDSNILFQDDFSKGSSGWSTMSEGEDKVDYADGVFRFTLNDLNYDYWSTPGLDLQDVHIEVDATMLGGPQDNDFGVICRYQDENNFYGMIISSDGYYGISKMKDGEHNVVSSGQLEYSDEIRQGEATNRIGADCIGSTLRLYVNGTQLVEYTDSEYTSGDIGLMAGTFDEPGVDISFDNLVVTKPETASK